MKLELKENRKSGFEETLFLDENDSVVFYSENVVLILNPLKCGFCNYKFYSYNIVDRKYWMTYFEFLF